MNQASEEKLMELKQAIQEDPRFVLLAKLDSELSASSEVKELAKKKDEAAEKYEDSLKHARNEEEIVKDRKALYEAKLALDSHPLIQQYNAAFASCREILSTIDDLLFSPYRSPNGKEGRKC